jgi:hypothetical protein
VSDKTIENGHPMTTIAKGVVDGAGAFLGRICLPAAEEFGLLLRDHVKHWRNKNFVRITRQAEELIANKSADVPPRLHPRVLQSIYENGSWSDEDVLQKMWAGLLAAACFDGGTDQSIFYVDILSKMLKNEAVLFEHVCKSTEWRITWVENTVEALPLFTEPNRLRAVTGLNSFEDIEEAISHLQHLGLVKHESNLSESKTEQYDSVENEEFDWESSGSDGQWLNYVELGLTSLGIRLFLKIQGIEKRPSEHFKDKVPRTDDQEDFYYEDWLI